MGELGNVVVDRRARCATPLAPSRGFRGSRPRPRPHRPDGHLGRPYRRPRCRPVADGTCRPHGLDPARDASRPAGPVVCWPAADGWVAVSLARPEDTELVAAITGVSTNEEGPTTGGDDDRAWAVLARYACVRPGKEVTARAQLLGVPATVVAAGPDGDGRRGRQPQPGGRAHRPTVTGTPGPALHGGRSVLVVGRAPVRQSAQRRRGPGDQGGEPQPSRRRSDRLSPVL